MSTDRLDFLRVRQRVADHVRRIRITKQLTQEAVAAGAGLYIRHFRKIESAEVNVTLETLTKLAAALDVDVAELLARPAGAGEE